MATNFTSQLHPGIFLEQKGTFDIISKIKVFFLFFFFAYQKISKFNQIAETLSALNNQEEISWKYLKISFPLPTSL